MNPSAILLIAFGLAFARFSAPIAKMSNAGAEDPTPSAGQRWFFKYVLGGTLVVLGVIWLFAE